MVVAPKPRERIRICVDLTLNEYIGRERLILPAVDETLAKLSGATVFTKQKMPQLHRLPFGILSAPEHL